MWLGDVRNYFSRNNTIECSQAAFTIQHFAGQVTYQAEGFGVKNKDTLFSDMVVMMKASDEPFAKAQGWTDMKVATGQKKRPPTVGKQFKVQVSKLMKALHLCTPHYIRCIKPNNTKRPREFEQKNVRRQVQYLGLLENVKVRRAGYAHREKFIRFVARYRVLCPSIMRGAFRGTEAQMCEEICRAVGWNKGKEFLIGKTKIFIQLAASLFLLEGAMRCVVGILYGDS
jgi:myosin I